jgi:hypothetical protein
MGSPFPLLIVFLKNEPCTTEYQGSPRRVKKPAGCLIIIKLIVTGLIADVDYDQASIPSIDSTTLIIDFPPYFEEWSDEIAILYLIPANSPVKLF